MKPLLDAYSVEIFGSNYPRARDLEKYTRLVLVSTHPAVDYPEPLPPNVISVGGLQIAEPKPLDKVRMVFPSMFHNSIQNEPSSPVHHH